MFMPHRAFICCILLMLLPATSTPLQDLIHQVQEQLLVRLGDVVPNPTPLTIAGGTTRTLSAFWRVPASGRVAPLSPAQGSRAGSIDGGSVCPGSGSGSGGSGSYTNSLLGTRGSAPVSALRTSKGVLREQHSAEPGSSSLSGADKRGSAPRRARFADDEGARAEPEPMAARMVSAIMGSGGGVLGGVSDDDSLASVRRAKSVTAGLPPIPPKRTQSPLSVGGPGPASASGARRGRLSTIFSDGESTWTGMAVVIPCAYVLSGSDQGLPCLSTVPYILGCCAHAVHRRGT
jgi:hypothetical protein